MMRYKFGDLVEIIDGDRGVNYPKQDEFYDEGYCLFLNTGNVTRDGFSFSSNQFITLEKDSKLRKGKLTRNDIVYTTRGTVGNAALYSPSVEFENVRINSGMIIIRKKDEAINQHYLYQMLKSETYRNIFLQYCSGSAQPQLPIKTFSKIKIDIPNITIQAKIADILTTYDDLIENNNKRIKLLEQMAENLYKEWFVRFRFPGYENAEFENDLPKGWKSAKLKDIAIEVGKSISKENLDGYDYYLPIDCIPNKSMHLKSAEDISNAESSLHSFKKGYILFGAMRPYFHKVLRSPIDGITRKTCFVISSKDRSYAEWLYLLLYQKNTVDFATTVSVGSTMPYVRWQDFSRMNIVLPDENTAKEFSKRVLDILNRINLFYFENENLIKQRDLLLPRLMSGKLEV